MIDHELYQGIFWYIYIYIPIIYQVYQYHVWMVCYNYMKWIMFGFMCWTPGINAIPSRWDPQILGTYGLLWMILIRFREENQVIFRHFSIVWDGKKRANRWSSGFPWFSQVLGPIFRGLSRGHCPGCCFTFCTCLGESAGVSCFLGPHWVTALQMVRKGKSTYDGELLSVLLQPMVIV